MNRRKILALFLVLALSGTSLAVQQQQMYNRNCNPDGTSTDLASLEHCAEGFATIQQHSVFVEMILETDDDEEFLVKEFAAIVGLVKKCKTVDNKFDNAVLWFNDQFLFGNKSHFKGNVTKDHNDSGVMGANPNRSINESDFLDQSYDDSGSDGTEENQTDENSTFFHTESPPEGTPDRDGFIRKHGMEQRWGGCFIPDGFILAVGDARGTDCQAGTAALNGAFEIATGEEEGDCDDESLQDLDCYGTATFEQAGQSDGECPGSQTWQERLKDDIEMDHECGGCMFDYIGSLYVTDPNFHTWIVDAYEGLGGAAAGQPVYAVHLQVDPHNPDRQGFADEAVWAYREDGRLRAGMPYNESADHPCHDQATLEGSEMYASDLNESDPDGGIRVANTLECAIEYNFLAAIAFDHTDIGHDSELGWSGHSGSSHAEHGENQSTPAWAGNSHPHNPYACYEGRDANNSTGYCEDGPAHDHTGDDVTGEVSVNLLFNEKAPFFTHNNSYWDEFGAPPAVDEDCQWGQRDNSSIQARDFYVCDVVADTGFHLHDGSQTVT